MPLLQLNNRLYTFAPLSQSIVNQSGLNSLLAVFDAGSQRPKSSLNELQNSIQRSWILDGSVAQVELIAWSRGFINPAPNNSYVFVLAGLSRPNSRGSVHITTKDPLAPPKIDFNFLGQDIDTQVLLNALRFVQNIGKKPPFSTIIAAQTSPDPNLQSDAELIEYIRASCAGGSHLIGTAALAPRDQGGVVDSSLRVYGTERLRIVDASVFPMHIASHTQATVYAIAEMAASEILKGE